VSDDKKASKVGKVKSDGLGRATYSKLSLQALSHCRDARDIILRHY